MIKTSGSVIFWWNEAVEVIKVAENHNWRFQIHPGSRIQFYFDVLKEYFLEVESWNIKLNFSAFSVRGCWDQLMLLFWKLVDEIQMGNPHDQATRDKLSKCLILLPLRAVYFRSFLYETSCSTLMNSKGRPPLFCAVNWWVSRGESPFLFCKLMNSRGRLLYCVLYVDEF